ncbi:SMEK domain-containing protein [Liquorilactobacillus capillatus]|nr:SMEK domain-containing protein [Liquorilactobacillus capillatus]
MNKEDVLRLINRRLSLWAQQIEMFSAANMHDAAIVAEPIIAQLLQQVFNWNLENLNEQVLNFPGADLIDCKNQILVQVTSTPLNAKKAKNTFEKLKKQPSFSSYRVLIFSLIVVTPSWAKKVHSIKNSENKIISKFDPKNNYLDFKLLYAELVSSSQFKLDKLEDILDVINEAVSELVAERNPLILEQLISRLSNADLSVNQRSIRIPPHAFHIQEKIKFNKLETLTAFILKNTDSELFDSIYKSFLEQGKNADKTIFSLLQEGYFFDQEVIAAQTSVQKFGKLIGYLTKYLNTNGTGFRDALGHSLGQDEIGRYIVEIVVDAFNRCEVFEEPPRIPLGKENVQHVQ